LFKKSLPSSSSTFIRDVTIYQVESSAGEKQIEGYVLTMVTGSETWEAFIKRCPNQIKTNNDEIEVEIKTGTNWDVKELVFRDPGITYNQMIHNYMTHTNVLMICSGGLSGPFSKIYISLRFKNVSKQFKAVALVQDPSGLPVDELEMEIPEGKSNIFFYSCFKIESNLTDLKASVVFLCTFVHRIITFTRKHYSLYILLYYIYIVITY